MAFDVGITSDGRYVIENNDVQTISYEQYVSQIIHCAVMELSLSMTSGKRVGDLATTLEEITVTLRAAVRQYPQIDPGGISVSIEDASYGNASLSVSYTGRGPNGSVIQYTSPFPVRIEGGAYKSIDLNPQWIATSTARRTVDAVQHIYVASPTKSIRLYCIPLCLTTESSDEDIHIYLTNGDEVIVTTTDVDVSVSPVVRLYDLSRYVSGVITDASIVSETSLASIQNVNGNYALFYQGNESTVVTCSLRVASAYAATTHASIQTDIGDNVFPLSPVKTSIFAHFEKTIQPGRYVIQWKGLVED